MRLPAEIKALVPIVSHVANYVAAQAALRQCATVDEVLEIRAKSEAAATYAKQMQDTSLFDMATRIKRRSERRLGEMLADAGIKTSHPTPGIKFSTQTAALALAKVPEPKFEHEIEKSPVPSAHAIVRAHRVEAGLFKPGSGGVSPENQGDRLFHEAEEMSKHLTVWLDHTERFGWGWRALTGMCTRTQRAARVKTLRALARRLEEACSFVEKMR